MLPLFFCNNVSLIFCYSWGDYLLSKLSTHEWLFYEMSGSTQAL